MSSKEKLEITEESQIHKEWYIKAEQQTVESLHEFINHVVNDYRHDYGTICHAMTACSIATIYAINKTEQGEITGFQAGAIMWEFIRNWNHNDNKCGMRLIDYDNMLYPQYAHKFSKSITKHIWTGLQKEARIKLEEIKMAHPEVVKHWKSIADGNIPFGYNLNDE